MHSCFHYTNDFVSCILSLVYVYAFCCGLENVSFESSESISVLKSEQFHYYTAQFKYNLYFDYPNLNYTLV